MRTIFTCLFLFIPFLNFAQSNYHSGYIVLNSGDTVKGYINSREWEYSPKTIQFKTSIQEKKIVTFSPSLIRSFTVANADEYISYTGKISMDPNDFGSAPTGIDTTSKQDTVFLKILYAGSKVSLLNNTDKIKQRLFIHETNHLPVELTFHQYYVEQTRLFSTIEYKRQLQFLAGKYNDIEQIKRSISNIRFTISDIEKILKEINQDKISQKNASSNRFFLGFGLAYQTTEFQGTNDFTKAGKVNYTSPFVSTGIDIFQNHATQKLIFRGELSIFYNAPKFSYLATYFSQADQQITYGFKQLNLAVTPQIIYNFYNSDALKVYLDAGIAFNFASYRDNKYTVSGTNVYDRQNYYELASFWATFPLKAGILLNKQLEIFAVYIYPATYTRYTGFSISTQTLGAGIHYCFDKRKR